MAKKQNIREVADSLGLSIATVSRVLNNKPDVNEETRIKVLQYVQEQNYNPRTTSSDQRIIAIVDNFKRHALQTYYFTNLLDAVDEHIHTAGYHTMLIHSDEIERQIRWPNQSRIITSIAGVVWSTPVFNDRFKSFFEDLNIPCVVINNCEKECDVTFIESDNVSATEQAVEYLAGLSHRKIGFIGGELHLTNFQERYDGYLNGMKKVGIKVDEQWSVKDISLSDTEGGVQALHRLLARNDIPSAVITSCDPVAFGIYKAAKQRSLTIPDDLSVLSFDDSVIAQYVSPPLTTFRQQLDKIGAVAVEKLLNILDGSHGKNSGEKIQIPMNLIVRDSVKNLETNT